MIGLLADIAVLTVGILHLLFLVLEMVLWDTPAGRRILGLTPEYARTTKTLAANQGLYNGFLAAGLLWSLVTELSAWQLQLFFLGCVVLAGVVGGITASRTIFWVQALPGAPRELLATLEHVLGAEAGAQHLGRTGQLADRVLERLLARTGRGDVERSEPRFSCACNRDRIRQAVVLLGRDETREIAHSGEDLEVRCEFCATSYRLTPDEVGALLPDA